MDSSILSSAISDVDMLWPAASALLFGARPCRLGVPIGEKVAGWPWAWPGVDDDDPPRLAARGDPRDCVAGVATLLGFALL